MEKEMKKATFIIILIIAILGWSFALYGVTRGATEEVKPLSCPAQTDKGVYHLRGYDSNGLEICGFTYFNACPYFEGAEAGTAECEKGKPTPEQLEPWTPQEDTVQTCK
jgi:hypothetical protein